MMNKLFKDLRTYFMLILIGIILWFSYQLFQFPVFSIKYLVIFIIVSIIVCIALIFSQYITKNKKIKIIGKIIIIILALLLIPLNYLFSTTMNALLKTENLVETENVSVIVRKESSYQYTQDLAGKQYAILAIDDQLVEKTIDKLERENIETITPKLYSGILTLVNALYNSDVDCIIINESYRAMIEDDFPTFSDDTRIVYSRQYISEVKAPENKDLTKDTFSVYISGIDTYGTIATKSRSDVNMIITINPVKKKILLTSIPRDYYIPFNVLNGQKDKLTHSGLYGVEETMKNVANYFNINIDYYVRVNFDSIIDIVNALGGIEVDNPRAFGDFQAGTISLNGEQALAFSRERYAFEQGDRERGRNQMRVITGIINKVISPAILNNYQNLLDTLHSSFQTSISEKQMIDLIRMQLDDMASWEIEQLSVDGYGESLYSPIYGSDLYMMVPNDESVKNAKNKIEELY